jgi:hypothetical protein
MSFGGGALVRGGDDRLIGLHVLQRLSDALYAFRGRRDASSRM